MDSKYGGLSDYKQFLLSNFIKILKKIFMFLAEMIIIIE